MGNLLKFSKNTVCLGFNSYIIFWAWLQDSLTWTCRVKKCRSSSGNLILGFAYETKIPQFIITSLQYNSGKNLFLALQLLYGPFKRPKNLNFYIQLVSMFFCTFCIWYATVCWFFHENWISEEHKFPASSFSTNKQCLQCFEFLNVLKWESKVCKSYPGFGRVSVTPDTWYDNKHVVKKKFKFIHIQNGKKVFHYQFYHLQVIIKTTGINFQLELVGLFS